jgi:hypothetical protein
MAGAASRKREPSQLGGLTLQAVLVDSQTSDFRFQRLPRNPEFGSRLYANAVIVDLSP